MHAHNLMALWFPLEFLLVIKRQAVQYGMLLFIYSCHSAFPVDLVHIDLGLTLQHGAPPNLPGFTEGQLEEKSK